MKYYLLTKGTKYCIVADLPDDTIYVEWGLQYQSKGKPCMRKWGGSYFKESGNADSYAHLKVTRDEFNVSVGVDYVEEPKEKPLLDELNAIMLVTTRKYYIAIDRPDGSVFVEWGYRTPTGLHPWGRRIEKGNKSAQDKAQSKLNHGYKLLGWYTSKKRKVTVTIEIE